MIYYNIRTEHWICKIFFNLEGWMSIIIANWKMNFTAREAEKMATYLQSLEFSDQDKLVVAAPHIHIPTLKKAGISIAGQNISAEFEYGPHTGEVNAKMLNSYGAEYCIIGHSETRARYNEGNHTIKQKIHSCINSNIIPIICIGETAEQKSSGQTLKILESYIKELFTDNISSEIIIAYEPIWSVGTGAIPSDKDLAQVMECLNNILKESEQLEKGYKLVYGGSVSEKNIQQVIDNNFVDRVLIGGASLDINKFQTLIDKL